MILKNNNAVIGLALGTILATVLVVVLTIVGELFSPLKDFLKEAHHHHWVGKGIWAAALFVFVAMGTTFMREQKNDQAVSRALRFLSYVLIFATAILYLFFTYEYAIHH